jgi:hypothetical protein
MIEKGCAEWRLPLPPGKRAVVSVIEETRDAFGYGLCAAQIPD